MSEENDGHNNGNQTLVLAASQLRESILAASAPKTKTVEGWGHTFTIKQLSAEKANSIYERYRGQEADIRLLAALIVHSLMDDAGEMVFSASDIDRVMAMSASEVMRVGAIINEFNGYTKSALQTTEKNSEPQNTDSVLG